MRTSRSDILMKLCSFVVHKHACLRVFLYFLHLVLTFTPHYIIMVKGPVYIMDSQLEID